ncbi:hypothetical protein NBM05_14220 [Rothia sp. AR01]|uniref:Uncharacterized protein n=1 Tax=Rothia santali TaxID=2949643 RepID=A0A9X2KJQ7_9MICC|nr:hypothetical protein [Rothia santali]MCP3427134.1 hypothetical protein [Rothia santali]
MPIVPVAAPDAGALRIQQRFAALAERGTISTLDAEREFAQFMAGDGVALPFREENRLDDVRRQILGDGGVTAAQPTGGINPAHLSGFSSSDIQTTVYDENLLGPMTMSVPIVFGSRGDAGGSRPQAADEVGETPRAVPSASADPDLSAEPEPSGAGSMRDVAPETVSAEPVSAMDAHGLDLTGLDQKAPGNGGKIALATLLVLVIAAAVVLGIVFLMP